MRGSIARAALLLLTLPLLLLVRCGTASEATSDAEDAGRERDASFDGPVSEVAPPSSDAIALPPFDAWSDAGTAPRECFAQSAAGLPSVEAMGAHAVGAFRVTVGAGGRIDVTHARTGARSLFATPAAQSLFAASRATLEAKEHQGSFAMTEQIATSCAKPRVDAVRSDGRVLALAGGFDDGALCGALRYELQLCEQRDGHLGFRLRTDDLSYNLLELHIASEASERIYGLGEQFTRDTLDLKHRAIPVLAQEGGVGRGHAVITPAVNLASPGSGGSEETTYYAAPHYLTSQNRSLFLEDPEYAVFDFRADDATNVRLFSPSMQGRILAGSSPLELIERFTEHAGRMPKLPDWAGEGAIVALAKSVEESQPIVDALLAKGAKISAVWNQTWSGKVTTSIGEQVLWNWVLNDTQYPDWASFVSGLAARNIRVLCYVNPMFRDVPPSLAEVRRNLFQEAEDAGYFVRAGDGGTYLFPMTAFDVALLDLTNDDARRWMKGVIRDELLGRGGCSGWMADFAEGLAFDARLRSGASAASYHNQYPVEWARLNREAIEEAARLGDVLVWNRSGHTRTPAYSLLVWEGDQCTTWDQYDGLASALHGLLNAGLSGASLVHSDAGGYTSLSRVGLGYSREAELLKRWTELSAFTAVLRTHEGNQPGANAQVYSDDEAMEHFARMTKVYASLSFYRSDLFGEAQAKGWPVVRHLMLHYPGDVGSVTTDDEFLLGSEILVAPIENKCWTPSLCSYDKSVYFPPGAWVHLWSGDVFGSAQAGVRATVRAPIGSPAVFYRKGSPIAPRWIANLAALGIQVPAAN